MHWRTIYCVLRESAAEFGKDNVPRLGAALAYYSIFSIAPLLIIAIAIASLLFGKTAAQGEIMDQIQGTVGPDAARAVQDMLQATDRDGGSLTATIVGIGLLFFGASAVFVQ